MLRTYAERGLVSVSKTKDEAVRALILDWKRSGGVKEPQKHVIVASTREEVKLYNDLAQAERARAGELDLSRSLTVGEETLYAGDQVTFLKNSRRLGVRNGDVGTIEAIKDWGWTKAISVRLGDGKKKPIVIPVSTYLGKKYDALRRGYVDTTHKLQGATLDNAYVALGGTMTDREMTYVQFSRGRNTTRLYAVEEEAGPALTRLARGKRTPPTVDLAGKPVPEKDKPLRSSLAGQMEKSRQEELAHEVQAAPPDPGPLDRDWAERTRKMLEELEEEQKTKPKKRPEPPKPAKGRSHERPTEHER